MSYSVVLYMYDISGGMASAMSRALVGRQIDAIWHTGIVLHGAEYYFDGGVGIERGGPGLTRFGRPVKTVSIGSTAQTKAQFEAWNRNQRSKFGPMDYNLLQRNCNHYTEDAAQFLCSLSIPDEVRHQVDIIMNTPMLQMFMNSMGGGNGNMMARGGSPPQQIAPVRQVAVPPQARDVLSDLAENQKISTLEAMAMIYRNTRKPDPKYRRMKKTSPAYQKHFSGNRGSVFLTSCGWRETTGSEGPQIEFSITDSVDDVLSAIQEAIEEAKILLEAISLSNDEPVVASTELTAMWKLWNGKPDASAVSAGREGTSDLYLARSIPMAGSESCFGKCGPSLGESINVVNNTNTEITPGRGEYLMIPKPTEARWKKGSLVDINNEPVVKLGLHRGQIVYAARGHHQGGIHPGYASPSIGCIIPYGGCGYNCQDFEYLLYSKPIASDSSDDMPPECVMIQDYHSLQSFTPQSVHPALIGKPLASDNHRKRNDSNSQKFIVCHDNHFTEEDRTPQELGSKKGFYQLRCYDLVDKFIYFTHNFVTIPPVGWINSCHNHGVPCLGTLIFEGQGGVENVSQIIRSTESAYATASLLKVVQETYNFDGWLLNVEVGVPQSSVENLIYFCSVLTEMCINVIWYDSVTVSGSVSYQNTLNSSNYPFFEACSGLFTNYGWKADYPATAAKIAGSRSSDVYFGIDVFGRGTYGGGGMDCDKAIARCPSNNVSCALFAPVWTYENFRDKYHEIDDVFWGKIRDSAYEKTRPAIASLPFFTTFDRGCGDQIFVQGKLQGGEYFDHSAESVFPLIPLESPLNVNSSVTSGQSYCGSHCITVDCSKVEENLAVATLFDVADVTVPELLSLRLVSRGSSCGLLLTFNDDSCLVCHPCFGEDTESNIYASNIIQKEGSWSEAIWAVINNSNKKLVNIQVLVILTSTRRVAEVGMLSLSDIEDSPLEIRQPVIKKSSKLITVSWTASSQSHFHSAHIYCGDVRLGRSHSNTFYTTPEMIKSGTPIRIQAIDTAGRFAPPVTISN